MGGGEARSDSKGVAEKFAFPPFKIFLCRPPGSPFFLPFPYPFLLSFPIISSSPPISRGLLGPPMSFPPFPLCEKRGRAPMPGPLIGSPPGFGEKFFFGAPHD